MAETAYRRRYDMPDFGYARKFPAPPAAHTRRHISGRREWRDMSCLVLPDDSTEVSRDAGDGLGQNTEIGTNG